MNLRTRLFVTSIIISFIFTFILIADRVKTHKEIVMESAEYRAASISAIVYQISLECLEKGNTKRLKETLEAFQHFKHIEYLRVAARDGKILYKFSEAGIKIDERLPDTSIENVNDNVYDLQKDIVRDDVYYGTLHLGVSINSIKEGMENILWRGIFWGLVFILVLTFVLWKMSSMFARHMHLLVKAVEHMSDREISGLPQVKPDTDIGKISGALANLHRDLMEERTRRENIDALKDDFFAMTVHDLKQPITVLKAAMSLILDSEEMKDIDQKHQERMIYLAKISVSQLTAMIGDLLNISRLSNPDVPLEKERIALGDLLNACAEEWMVVVKSSDRKWSFNLPDDIKDCWIYGENVLLRRVVGNFILNAIQYTPEKGHITLGARFRDREKAEIYVSDEGYGIPDSFREEIFKKYKTMSKTGKNVGLGLAFCRMVAERHLAFIDVNSAPGKGTEMMLIIPVSCESSG